MSYRNTEKGFTLLEIMLVVTIASILAITLFSFFSGALSNYFALQQDAVSFSSLSSESQRIGRILRGATDVKAASSTDLTVYAYFSPQDAYPSQVRYFVSGTQLLAEVTPLSSPPPIGTPVTAQKRTYTIINKLQVTTGIFTYLNSAGGTLTSLANLRDVKGVKVTLSVPPTKGATVSKTTVVLSVSLRNRKTNL